MTLRRFFFLLSVLVIGSSLASAQSPAVPGYVPPLIRITGALYDPEEKFESTYASFEVRIGDQLWTLRVRNVESLTTNAPGGIPLLRNLGGFFVLTGPSGLTSRLVSAECRGQPVTIEGRLYVKERVLAVTAVEPRGVVAN